MEILNKKGIWVKLIFRQIVCYSILLQSIVANGAVYQFSADKRIQVKISKSGLNRISNPPYRIEQLTGDDSKFRIKHDEDGSNIYFMPLGNTGESIEISVKNNAGEVQDLELVIANIKGRSIIIDSKPSNRSNQLQKSDISEMLRAMKDNKVSKFYVQHNQQQLGDIDQLQINQQKIYKYKELIGGVFEIINPTENIIKLDSIKFARNFDNVRAFYPEESLIRPNQTMTLLVIQAKKGK